MSYFDRYKKRAGKRGTTQNEIMRGHALENIERNFSHIVGCTPVKVNEDRMTEMIIESSADDLTKKAIAKPNEEVAVGDYLKFNDRLWLVQTINWDVLTPVCSLLICNQHLNAKWFKQPIPCHANNTTYGSKGLIDNGAKFFELDAKTKIYIQKNKDTDRLDLGFRFILNHRYVYRITEIENTIYGGIYVITCQMDEGTVMDDFENNLAYNKNEEFNYGYKDDEIDDEIPDIPEEDEEENPSPPIELPSPYLVGEDKIKRKGRYSYRLENGFASRWSVDDETLAQVNPLPMNEVELITHQTSGWITLTCEYETGIIPATEEEIETTTQTITKEIMIY